MEKEVDSCFLKKYSFRSFQEDDWSCEKPFENPFWTIEELEKSKSRLNSTKRLLSQVDSKKWHEHTAFSNRAGAVFQKVKKDVNPELLTQAWLKFYECLHQFDLISDSLKNNPVFHSIHLCEAPGAFVTSLNHFLRLNFSDIEFRWTATTLNPYYEGNSLKPMIRDDRFICQTLKNWNFGTDDTGNIMEWCNVAALLQSLDRPVDLVTADGSINCADNPGEQEVNLAQLHWCETISALLVLNNGGSFVLKIFTLFEHPTISLLYLLFLSFEKLHVFKPCTSKEGNSEMYLIALRFTKTEKIIGILRMIQLLIYERKKDVSSNPLFSLSEIPTVFIDEIICCSKLFTTFQEEAILRNLSLYNFPFDERNVELVKNEIANRFVLHYSLRRIPQKLKLMGAKKMKRRLFNTETRKDIFLQDVNATRDNICEIQSEIEEIDSFFSDVISIHWENPERNNWQSSIYYVYGKPYVTLCNTSFCHTRTFLIYESLSLHTDDKRNSLFTALLSENQIHFLNVFYATHLNMGKGDNFTLKDIPVLSRFSVASVWIVSLLFSKIELIDDNGVELRFSDFTPNFEVSKFIQEIDPMALNFIELSKLFDETFCRIVSNYNTKLLLKFSRLSLKTIMA